MNFLYPALFLLCLSLGLSAQPEHNQHFAAAAYLGANFAQIHGDSYFGYNHFGLRFGIETQYLLRPKYFVSLGIGYSREGARPDRKEVDARGGNAATLKLNMIELPLLFNYRLGDERLRGKKHDYALLRSTTLQAGLKLTRLVGYRTTNRGYLDQLLVSPDFKGTDTEFQNVDVAVVGGVTFGVGLHYAVFVQHSLSVRGLYRREDLVLDPNEREKVLQLRPYSLTIGGKVTLY